MHEVLLTLAEWDINGISQVQKCILTKTFVENE